jgi:hypothetical protein
MTWLQADYGIVVGSNKLLRQVARYFGVGVTPLVKAPLSGPGPRGVLYETQSWAEVEAFVFGPRRQVLLHTNCPACLEYCSCRKN